MERTVLVADDHAGQRKGLVAFVTSMAPRTRVIEATNGREAVEAAIRERPALVLMDVKMPELDGIAATRQIKTAVASVRVAVVTLRDDRSTREAAGAAGADAYVVKGHNRALERVVRTFLL